MTIKLSEKEQAGYDILRAEMTDSLAMEIVEYRRDRKAKITARIAKALLKEYKAFGDIEKAFEIQTMRNWISFECSWVQPKGRNYHDMNNPMPSRPTANYGRAEPVPSEQLSEQDKENRRQMVARLRAEGILGRTMQ